MCIGWASMRNAYQFGWSPAFPHGVQHVLKQAASGDLVYCDVEREQIPKTFSHTISLVSRMFRYTNIGNMILPLVLRHA